MKSKSILGMAYAAISLTMACYINPVMAAPQPVYCFKLNPLLPFVIKYNAATKTAYNHYVTEAGLNGVGGAALYDPNGGVMAYENNALLVFPNSDLINGGFAAFINSLNALSIVITQFQVEQEVAMVTTYIKFTPKTTPVYYNKVVETYSVNSNNLILMEQSQFYPLDEGDFNKIFSLSAPCGV